MFGAGFLKWETCPMFCEASGIGIGLAPDPGVYDRLPTIQGPLRGQDSPTSTNFKKDPKGGPFLARLRGSCTNLLL